MKIEGKNKGKEERRGVEEVGDEERKQEKKEEGRKGKEGGSVMREEGLKFSSAFLQTGPIEFTGELP